MTLSRRGERLLPGLLAASFAGTMAVSVVLSAVLLDSFLIRYDRGSVTTMLPGFVYGLVLILKIGLVESAVLGVFAFVAMAARRSPVEDGVTSRVPIWATFSLILPALAPLIGTLVILVGQSIVEKPVADSLVYFTQVSSAGVLCLIAILFISIGAAVASLVRRERPAGISVIGLAANVIILALFFYWEFYKLGFDQDRWNNI